MIAIKDLELVKVPKFVTFIDGSKICSKYGIRLKLPVSTERVFSAEMIPPTVLIHAPLHLKSSLQGFTGVVTYY